MKATKTPAECFAADLKGVYDTVQDETLATLAQAREYQLAARALMDLEAARLARKLGGDAVRVRTLKAQAADRAEKVRALDVEAQIAAVRMPPLQMTDTLLHGRVTDQSLNRVAGVSVQLVNAKGEAVPGVSEARTDAQGYYAFVLKPEQAQALADEKLAVAVASGDQKLRPAQAELALAPGATAVREIRLSDAELVRLNLRPAARGTPATRPPAGEPGTSTPLENVRGIGPVRAKQLRAAGIPDLEALLNTDMKTLVKIMGFDAHVSREEAEKLLKAARAAAKKKTAPSVPRKSAARGKKK